MEIEHIFIVPMFAMVFFLFFNFKIDFIKARFAIVLFLINLSFYGVLLEMFVNVLYKFTVLISYMNGDRAHFQFT